MPLRVALLSVCAAVTIFSGYAADLGWTSHGPDGGSVSLMAFDPGNPDVAYAGTFSAGVFKSVDRGGHWAPANGGLPIAGVDSLALDPNDPNTVYAVITASLYKSVDGGGRWTALPLPVAASGAGYPQTLAVDPKNPGTILVATCDTLFRSSDGGSTWSANPIASGGGFVCPSHLTLDPVNSDYLYAASSEGLLRSADGGRTWILPLRNQLSLASGATFETCDAWGYYLEQVTGLAAPKPEALNCYPNGNRDAAVTVNQYLSGLRIYLAQQPNPAIFGVLAGPESIVVDRRNSGALYAATYWGIFKSADFGASWSPIVSGLPKNGVVPHSLAGDADPATLYVSSFSTTQPGVYRSTDGGANWGYLGAFAAAPPPDFLFAAPATPGVVYAGNSFSFYKSVDGGGAWNASNRGLSTASVASIAVDPQDSKRVYAAIFSPIPSGPGGRILRSEDRGVTWTDTGLPASSPTLVVTAQRGVVYALACCVPQANPSGSFALFRSTDGGARWENPGSLPKASGGRLIVDSQDPFAVYLQTTDSIYASADGGAHWQQGGTGDLFRTGLSAFVADPAQGGVLYAGRYNPDATDGGIYRSDDQAVTWEAVNVGWPKDLYYVIGLVIDRRNPSTLYASTQELDCDYQVCPNDYYQRLQSAPGAGVFKTTDGGRTWSKLTLPIRDTPVRLVGDPDNPETLYAVAAYPNRILRSTDAGATWNDISPELLTTVSGLVAGGTDQSTIYAATIGAGVLEISIPRAQ